MKKVIAKKKNETNSINREVSSSQLEDVLLNDFDAFTSRMGIGLIDADEGSVGSSGVSDIFRSSDAIISASLPYYHDERED